MSDPKPLGSSSLAGASCAWFLLAVEARRVIELRLARLALGGPVALAEAQLMMAEKVTAAIEAMATLMLGGSPECVVARYREHVAANEARLSEN